MRAWAVPWPKCLRAAPRDTGPLPARFAFAAAATVIAALLLLPGCAVRGLEFIEDTRVDIVQPKDRAKVRLPVTVRWTAEDFAVGPGQGSFAVLVDRAPPPSGKTLSWLFRRDVGCRGAGAERCASSQFLEDRSIFTTTERSVTIAQVPRLAGSQAGRQMHEATVVLLDHAGRRIGESAWSVLFEVEGRN